MTATTIAAPRCVITIERHIGEGEELKLLMDSGEWFNFTATGFPIRLTNCRVVAIATDFEKQTQWFTINGDYA